MTNYNYLPRTSLKVGGIIFKSQNKRSYVLKELSDFLYYNNCYKTFKEELRTQFGKLNNEEVTVGSLEDYGYQEMPPHENLIYFVIEHNYTRSVISVDLDGIIKIHHIGEIDFQHDISFDSPDLKASFDKWKNANGFSDININDILLRLGIVDDIDLTLESSSFTAASYFNKDISEASFCFYRKAFTWETCDHMYSKTGHNIIFINNYIVVFDSVSWLYENPTKTKIYKVTRNKMGRLKIKRSYFPPFRILRTSNNYVSHVMSDGTLDIDLRRPYCSPNIKPGPVGPNKYSEIFFRGLYLAFPENCVWERKLKDKNDLF